MARLFDDGSSQYLAYGAPLSVIAPPFSMACLYYSDDLTINQGLMIIWGSGTAYHALGAMGAWGGDNLVARTYTGSAGQATIGPYTVNAWESACGVWPASDDRRVYMGGVRGTDNATDLAPTTDQDFHIGHLQHATAHYYLSGRVAEAAAWNTALSDADAAVLAENFSPLLIKPENLIHHWQLVRDDNDVVGGYDLTPQNAPTIGAHPPILYPAPPLFTAAPAAAPAAGQPMSLRGTTVPHLRQWHPRVV